MSATPVLLATCDDDLLDEVLRLAAAAGVPVDVAHDPDAALRAWTSAPAVLVGADQAARLGSRHPPRREAVHVVGRAPLPDRVFREAVAVGAREVLELPEAETWLAETLADVADGLGARAAPLVGVVAGSGGAGASTFAAALALVAGAAATAVLVDLDPWGAGLHRTVGVEQGAGVRWEALADGHGRLGSRSLLASLPGRGSVSVLGWGPAGEGPVVEPPAEVVAEVLAAARRGGGLVVVDLPRSLDGVAAQVAARCSALLVVCEGSVGSVLAAGRVVARARSLHRDVALVVRGASAGVAPHRAADALGVRLLADYPTRRSVAERVELGLGPVPGRRSALARAARQALADVADAAPVAG